MQFIRDRFSEKGPVWIKLTLSERVSVVSLVGDTVEKYTWYLGSVLHVYRVSGLEINSSNLLFEGTLASVVVKVLSSKDLMDLSFHNGVYSHIEKFVLPAPQIIGFEINDSPSRSFLIMRYVVGNYFSGSKFDVAVTGEAIQKFHRGISTYPILDFPEASTLQENSGAILTQILAISDQWQSKFGPGVASLLASRFEYILDIERQCSANIPSLISMEKSILHEDLHPHNIIVGSGKATIIDIDSLKLVAWPSSLGFAFYKLSRQIILENSLNRECFRDVRDFFDTIMFDYSSHPEIVRVCLNGALTEVLKRLLIVLEGNLDGHTSPWNPVLAIQIRGLCEVKFLYESLSRGRFSLLP